MQWLIGIDEAGRGPLAGPVSVGAVMVRKDFDTSSIRGVRDSKQLTALARDEWYAKLCALQKEGIVSFAVSFSSARMIDARGIVPAIRSALVRCLDKLGALPEECSILLDGSLYAPKNFTDQRTIIRGDQTEPLISLASIAAKVTRDRYMSRLASRYPEYAFDVHKGYGTLAHRRAIRASGLSEIHRVSFCTRLRIPAKSV